jgi:ATP-binding cassette subfamily B (MDR/TAP) protein 1
LNAVQIIIDRFVTATEKSYQEGIRLLKWIGLANGTMMGSMILGYMVIALYGAFLIYDSVRNTGCDPSGAMPNSTACDPDGADVVGSLMGITFAAAVLPQVSVGVEAFTDARAACYPALQIINRKIGDEDVRDTAKGQIRRGSSSAPLPKYSIDSSSKDGVELDSVDGCIEFKNVTFAYPTRQETNIFDGFSLKIEAGKTVALVGPR